MKLKYSSIFLFMATSLFGGNALADDNTNPKTNQITFTGKIVEASCNVAFETPTKDRNVQLGNHATGSFLSTGDKSSPVAFKIIVSDCDTEEAGYSNHYIGFSARLDKDNPKLLAVTGGATGVGIGVTRAGEPGQYIDMSGLNSENNRLDNNEINLQAFYEKSSDKSVTAGDATATAIVTVSMN